MMKHDGLYVCMFKVKYYLNQVNNILAPNNTWIGLGIPGIVVGRDLDESRVLEVLHQWSNMLKVDVFHNCL